MLKFNKFNESKKYHLPIINDGDDVKEIEFKDNHNDVLDLFKEFKSYYSEIVEDIQFSNGFTTKNKVDNAYRTTTLNLIGTKNLIKSSENGKISSNWIRGIQAIIKFKFDTKDMCDGIKLPLQGSTTWAKVEVYTDKSIDDQIHKLKVIKTLCNRVRAYGASEVRITYMDIDKYGIIVLFDD